MGRHADLVKLCVVCDSGVDKLEYEFDKKAWYCKKCKGYTNVYLLEKAEGAK